MATPWVPNEAHMYQRADAMHAQIQRTQSKLSKSRSELEEAVNHRSTTPSTATRALIDQNAEIQQLKNQITVLETQLWQQQQALVPIQQELRRSRQQLEQQDVTIRQQEMTIRNQSRAIAQPRPNKNECTPFRSISDVAGSSSAPQPAPRPIFNTPTGQQPPTEPRSMRPVFGTAPVTTPTFNRTGQQKDPFQDNIGQPTPVRSVGRFLGTNALGSPIALRDVSNLSLQDANTGGLEFGRTANMGQPVMRPENAIFMGQGTLSGPALTQAWNMQHAMQPGLLPTQMQQPFPCLPESVMTPGPPTPRLDPVTGLFSKVFDMALKYAYTHVNSPSNHADGRMPEHIKGFIMRSAGRTSAFPLMASQKTRYFLVAKVIIEWIINNVLHDTCFNGLDILMDRSIAASRAKVYHSTPSSVRDLYLNAIVHDYSILCQHVDWHSFVGGLCTQRTTELYGIILPMMHVTTPRRWHDMYDMIVQAHHLAENMFTNIEEFRFDFPESHSFFDTNTMLNLDPGFVGMNEQQTSGRGRNVKLAVAPSVTARGTAWDGNMNSKLLVKASVILR